MRCCSTNFCILMIACVHPELISISYIRTFYIDMNFKIMKARFDLTKLRSLLIYLSIYRIYALAENIRECMYIFVQKREGKEERARHKRLNVN